MKLYLRVFILQARSVFNAFIDLDDDNSGQVAVDEFYRYLGVPKVCPRSPCHEYV